MSSQTEAGNPASATAQDNGNLFVASSYYYEAPGPNGYVRRMFEFDIVNNSMPQTLSNTFYMAWPTCGTSMFGVSENGRRTLYYLDVQGDFWSLDVSKPGSLPTKLTETPVPNSIAALAYAPNERSPAVYIGQRKGNGFTKLYLTGTVDQEFKPKVPASAGDCYDLYADGDVVFGLFDNLGGEGGNLVCSFDASNGNHIPISGTHGGPYSDGLVVRSNYLTGKLYHVPGAGYIPALCLSGEDGIYTYTYSGGAPITGAVDLDLTGHVSTGTRAAAVLAGGLNRNEPAYVYGTEPGYFFEAAADGSGSPNKVAIEGLPCSNQNPAQIVESENRFYILMAEGAGQTGVVAVFDKNLVQNPAHFIPGDYQPNAVVWMPSS